jgi:hypothetical protein
LIRTQIQFTEPQIEALRQLSAKTGHSIAHLTRDAINLYLEQHLKGGRDASIERAIKVAGQFASGLHDISADHDRYLSEVFSE